MTPASVTDNMENTPKPAPVGSEQEQAKQVKPKVALLLGVAIGVICVTFVPLTVYSFWLDWPSYAISDLPLLFWVLYGVSLGTLVVTLGVLEFRAWHDKSRTNSRQLSSDLWWGTCLVILFFCQLVGGWNWNGMKLVMVSLVMAFLLQWVSDITRRFGPSRARLP